MLKVVRNHTKIVTDDTEYMSRVRDMYTTTWLDIVLVNMKWLIMIIRLRVVELGLSSFSWLNKSDSRYAIVRLCLVTFMITDRIWTPLSPSIIVNHIYKKKLEKKRRKTFRRKKRDSFICEIRTCNKPKNTRVRSHCQRWIYNCKWSILKKIGKNSRVLLNLERRLSSRSTFFKRMKKWKIKIKSVKTAIGLNLTQSNKRLP